MSFAEGSGISRFNQRYVAVIGTKGKSTICTAAGLSPDFTAHLGRSCLRRSYYYAPAHDRPSCTREINRQIRQLTQNAGWAPKFNVNGQIISEIKVDSTTSSEAGRMFLALVLQ
jgi:hypothetical protein